MSSEEVKQMVKDYEREKEWASSIVIIGDSMVTCLVCGQYVEESSEGTTMKLICPNGHELSLRTIHSNN